MDFEAWFDIAALLVIAAICGLAVYRREFDDTLLQCFALGGMGIGAVCLAFWIHERGHAPFAVSLCIWMAWLFALETGRKIAAKIKRGTFIRVKPGPLSQK